MTRPGQIGAALAAMRAEADLWRRQSQRMVEALTLTTTYQITGLGWTYIFQDFLDRYNEVNRTFADRCAEGRDATGRIGDALAEIAQTYEEEERANLHAQRNLY